MMSCHETDPAVIARKEKQREYGKNLDAYKRYVATIPKDKSGPRMVQTPKINKKYRRQQ